MIHFVLMPYSQSGDPANEAEQPEYSRPEVDENVTRLLRYVAGCSFLFATPPFNCCSLSLGMAI